MLLKIRMKISKKTISPSQLHISTSQMFSSVTVAVVATVSGGSYFYLVPVIVKLRQGSGKGQARMGKGWPLRQKASKLKPLPRAYIKVGCHLPPPPPPDV